MAAKSATRAQSRSAEQDRVPWRNRIVGSGQAAPSELLANPRNWRTHPTLQHEALAGVLDQVGWVGQVLVNRTTGHLVDGHLRVELALARSEPTIPVAYVELSEDEEALVLATLDPLAALAVADGVKLAELLAQVQSDDAAVTSLLAELADANHLRRAGVGDPDEAPPLPEPADVHVKQGELWLLGEHRLLVGDATTDLPQLMGEARAECIWTDPPYGVDYVGKTRDALVIENDDGRADALVQDVFRASAGVVVDGAPFYCAGPAGPRSLAYQLAILAAGFRIHEELVWVKDVFVLGHSDYHYRHEPIFYGYAPGAGRPGRGKHRGTKWYGGNAAASVFEVPRPRRSEEHPTMKPVDLVASQIANSTRPGEIVLDPFVGSGSTIIAAEQLGRRCYALEIEPRYAQVAIERWQALTGSAARVGPS